MFQEIRSMRMPYRSPNHLARRFLIVITLFSLAFASALIGGSIRINNRVIETGMSKGKVFLLAGEPDWKSKYSTGDYGHSEPLGDPVSLFSGDTSFVAYSGSFDLIGPIVVEEWLFDQGSNRLMQMLRFENERLVSIVSIGYGFDDGKRKRITAPNWTMVQAGDTTYEVLQKVGEPTITEDRPEVGLVRVYGPIRNSTLHFRTANVSWWYYNSGRNRLFRIVKLLNGRVVEIATEGFGEG